MDYFPDEKRKTRRRRAIRAQLFPVLCLRGTRAVLINRLCSSRTFLFFVRSVRFFFFFLFSPVTLRYLFRFLSSSDVFFFFRLVCFSISALLFFLQVLTILCGSDEVLGSAAGRSLLRRCLSDVFSYGKELDVLRVPVLRPKKN